MQCKHHNLFLNAEYEEQNLDHKELCESIKRVKDSVDKLETKTSADLTREVESLTNSIARAAETVHQELRTSVSEIEQNVSEVTHQLDTTVTMLTSSVNEVENRVNSRMDNIIANSSSTEGNSELIDIRTGNDGTVYTTAGTAVRSQFNFINNDLIRKYSILTNGIFEISFNWKQGGFDTTDGKTLNTASSTRIYEDDYIIGDGVTEMIWTKNLGEDINLWVYKYDINGSYISYTQYDSTSVKFTLENGYQYRFNLYRSNGADISDLVKNISFSMSADIYQSNSLLKQHIDNISEQVDNLSEHIDNIPEHYIPNVHIMNEYNAVVGRELNFYWCQIFDCMNWKALEIIPRMTTNSNSVTVCQYDDRFSVIPTQSGDFTLTFTLTTLNGNDKKMTGSRMISGFPFFVSIFCLSGANYDYLLPLSSQYCRKSHHDFHNNLKP